MKTHTVLALTCLSLLMPSLFGQTNTPAANPSDQLQQLTLQLQNSPDNEALREQIIALALTLNPKPATPDAVTMAEGGAEYAFKNAQTNSDFSDAAKQYEKALLLAPWLAADYFNCGVAHEKASEYKEAIRNFNLYLLAAPDASDATDVKKRIGGLQYAEQKAEDAINEQNSAAAQQQAAAQAAAVAAEQKERDFLNLASSLAGTWNQSFTLPEGHNDQYQVVITVTGSNISIRNPNFPQPMVTGTIVGSQSTIYWVYGGTDGIPSSYTTISANQIHIKFSNGFDIMETR
jgi:tetratricopeptide (TPR) repeat protein